MSYDVNFWRYTDESQDRGARDHRAVYRTLCEDRLPEGLEPLPEEAIRKRVAQVMQPTWDWDGFAWVRPGTVIEQHIRSHNVRFDLRGVRTGDDVNPLVNLMGAEFGCCLYDPQVGAFGERFALPEQNFQKTGKGKT